MIFVTLCIVLAFTILIKYILYKRHMESYVKYLPTLEPSYPFLGNAHEFIGKTTAQLFKDIVQFIKDKSTPTKSWIGPCLIITLDKPEDIRTVLMSSSCLDKPYMYRFLPSTVGILTAKSGAFWKPIRKLMNPSFSLKILQSFVPIFNEKTNIMLKNLDKDVNNTNFDISEYMFPCTLDMVCATTMGFNVDVQRDKNAEFLKSIETMCEIVGKRFIKFWSHPNFIYRWTDLYKIQVKHCDIINNLTSRIRNIKKKEYLANNKNQIDDQIISENSTPQVLINQLFSLFFGGKFTEQIVKEQIETVIIAGNETSALTISYTLLLLAMYPSIQNRVFEELCSVYKSKDEYSSYERIQQLKYLDCVIKESMRLFPVAPFIVRCCIADTALSTFTIPKDAIIMMSLFNLHRREDIWGQDSNEFNPDHFLPELSSERHAFSFLPFSGGPRNCIGLQYAMISMKVILAGILRKYKFTTELELKDLVMRFELTLKLVNKHIVHIERRAWP